MSKLRNLSRRGWILVGFTTFAATVLPAAASTAQASTSVRSTSLGTLLATLPDPAPQVGDSFGASVAVSGSTAVVGASGENSHEGEAYIYVKGTSRWPTTPTATLEDPGSTSSGDLFGSSVAVSGSAIVIGAYGTPNNSKKGKAYIYERGASGWPTAPTVTLSDPAARSSGDLFGSSVAVSGNTIVVGAWGTSVDAGAAYVYVKGASGWPTTPTSTLNDPGATESDVFGSSVAVSGKAVVVGARGSSGDDGAAYVYVERASGWPTKPSSTLKDPAATADDAFGSSVGVSGSTAVVGAPGTSGYHGATYVYVKGASGWPTKASATIKNPAATADDVFGSSVGVSGSTAVVGAPGTSGYDGASYVYVKGASGWPTKASATLENPDSTDADQFGASVAVSGKNAVAGIDPADSYGEPVCIYKA
jgi:hypothetical protein